MHSSHSLRRDHLRRLQSSELRIDQSIMDPGRIIALIDRNRKVRCGALVVATRDRPAGHTVALGVAVVGDGLHDRVRAAAELDGGVGELADQVADAGRGGPDAGGCRLAVDERRADVACGLGVVGRGEGGGGGEAGKEEDAGESHGGWCWIW